MGTGVWEYFRCLYCEKILEVSVDDLNIQNLRLTLFSVTYGTRLFDE